MKIAVIETGGKQYVASDGVVLVVNKLSKGANKVKEGAKMLFDKVLLTSDGKKTEVGTPYLTGIKIEATLESEEKGKKVIGLRYKNKTRQSTTPYGHRQIMAKVRVTKV